MSGASPSSSSASSPSLPFGTLFAYGVPRIGFGAVIVTVAMYLAKFGTDVLLIPPVAMAAIHSIGRLWDGVSDPIVGHLSDRTRSRFGRRRPWLMASALPIFFGVVVLWSPPQNLGSFSLIIWMGGAFLFYETVQTIFMIPHAALGMELTPDYHERTRLFAWTYLFTMIGTLAGLAIFHRINTSSDPRTTAKSMALFAGAIWALTVAYAALRVPEERKHMDRPAPNARKAFVDVMRNPHARVLLLVYGIETLGAGAIITLTPFVVDYILGEKAMATWLGLSFLVSQAAFTPVLIALAKRLDKKKLWLSSMVVAAVGYVIQLLYSPAMPKWLLLGTPAIIGITRAIAEVCAPAIKADIIDFDEMHSGERKEGAYLAAWNMVRKAAMGLSPFLALTALQVTGYVPNAQQNEATILVLRFFYGGLPALSFIFGIALLARYSLSRDQHAEIRRELDRRATATGG